MKAIFPAAIVLGAVLSGCQQDTKAAKATGGNAEGQVLPGSTSDAMIPLDSLRSQPPAAPRVDAASKDTPEASDSANDAVTATPAEAPATEASPAAN